MTCGVSAKYRRLAALIVAHLVFCGSGVVQNLCTQLLVYSGIGNTEAMILVLPNVLGNTASVFQLFETSPARRWDPLFWPLITTDLVGQLCLQMGIRYAGSSIFTVIYASCVVWAAIFRVTLLKRPLDIMHWVAVVVLIGGLAISTAQGAALGSNETIGISATFGAALLYAGNYVISEKIFSKPNPPDRLFLQAWSGIAGLTVVSSYIVLHTGANWDSLVTAHYHDPQVHLTYFEVVGTFFLCAAACWSHNWAFYHIVEGSSVVVGVNKGAQSILTFIFSAVLYCNHDSRKNQCFGTWKGISLVVVVSGILMYAYGTHRQRKAMASGDGWAPLKNEAEQDGQSDSEVHV